MWNWDYATYCDFGDETKKRRISKHFSLTAADRAFKRLSAIYSHRSRISSRENWRLWQENRAGDHIINDTGKPDPVMYA
jgi:hypothetical protein